MVTFTYHYTCVSADSVLVKTVSRGHMVNRLSSSQVLLGDKEPIALCSPSVCVHICVCDHISMYVRIRCWSTGVKHLVNFRILLGNIGVKISGEREKAR